MERSGPEVYMEFEGTPAVTPHCPSLCLPVQKEKITPLPNLCLFFIDLIMSLL